MKLLYILTIGLCLGVGCGPPMAGRETETIETPTGTVKTTTERQIERDPLGVTFRTEKTTTPQGTSQSTVEQRVENDPLTGKQTTTVKTEVVSPQLR